MAVACLFWRILFEDTGGQNPSSWVRCLSKKEPIVVNGERWDWPESYYNG